MFLNFYLLKLLSSIHGVPTVGFRRVKHEKCSTRRGLAWEQKTKDFSENSEKKFGKILVFSFSQIYGVLLDP